MITLKNLRLPLKYSKEELKFACTKALRISSDDVKSVSIKRLSIDARKKNDVHYIATLNIEISGNEKIIVSKNKNTEITNEKKYTFKALKNLDKRPVIIGAGPAGLFCGLILARNGANPIIIERGECIENRTKTINLFWEASIFNSKSNVQFGEGGAGTFSDGKLNTGINDVRSRFILEEFVNHGGPEEILISAKPHIGTDELKGTIINIRKEIENLGGTFHFNSLVTDLIISDNKIKAVSFEQNGVTNTITTDNVVLAIGHSARDTFEMLKNKNIEMQQKAFSIGVRVEHLREEVDECQYGKARHLLPAADYKLNTHLKNGRGVYSFCMCPGGVVVNASSEDGMLCVNGMSYHARDGVNSNSAILVSVTPEDYNQNDVLDGVKLQRMIEAKTYSAIGNHIAPVQCLGNFLGKDFTIHKKIEPTVKPGFDYYCLDKIFPNFISDSLKEGFYDLANKMYVFNDMAAVLTAAETRSSSPVRIIRNDNLQSKSCTGLYPCGEGAGYAGGIMSAAVDGIKCAEAILS
ncbi:MAG: hypothetical protein E7566_00625 [Ruminococcaceae bacterium]|nr:hypothetical protein [Oscillospiraceae bacterium]